MLVNLESLHKIHKRKLQDCGARTMRSSFFVVLIGSILFGCQRTNPQIAPPEIPAVSVSKPEKRMVTEYVDFTGRANAVATANIIPRVTGFLVKIAFQEGTEVKGDRHHEVAAGTLGILGLPTGFGNLVAASFLIPGRGVGGLLFEIDPRQYQAKFAAALAQVAVNEASLRLAKVTNARFKDLSKKEPGAVSQLDLDKYQALEDQAKANLDLAGANLDSAKLNLDWTKVTSPIDGKISRYYLSLGNLVTADQTLLTTVLALEPIYAYFDMDEPTYLRIKRAINDGKIKLPSRNQIPVFMGLQGEEGFPHQGTINFVDNQVFPSTGSISWRGQFPNPQPPGGTRLLAPGMFLRIRLPIGQPHDALLVIDRAIWSEQGIKKNVYVVDKNNTVQARPVTTGSLQEDGLRVVEGLKADDLVVVGALQQIRPRLVIRPEQIPMPTLGGGPVAIPPKKKMKNAK
jgi:multidrug efflux system membrane fusion protein